MTMKLLWDAIKKSGALLISVFAILWQLIKYLIGKCWKLILIIFGALFGIKLAKQAISKEE